MPYHKMSLDVTSFWKSVRSKLKSGHEILHALTQKLGSLKTKRNRLQEEQQQLRIEFVLGHFLKKQNAFLDTK